MKKLLLIVLSGMLISCATYEHGKQRSLYENYKKYISALQTRNFNAAVGMLTSNNREQFHQSKEGEDFNAFFPFFSSVDSVVTAEKNYYQSIAGTKGCLTINGFDASGEPTSLNFELKNEKGAWKFDFVQMMYHSSSDKFLSSAKCPVRPKI